ncbi:DUF4012 domain-containing protein [Cellulomonas sp. C5510]|uniref:DUF4012 domain-containing protein n=1 Tax=Cellulomonas sp. C5510 TaxID=2871170 RepID=UPI001C947D9B|nr:DUF4012 domain-containing protein [Cellulomonas sp. C5510]QZN85438.1 DUF4012 domain-containing protein [Cellulomonas sp. C5510]
MTEDARPARRAHRDTGGRRDRHRRWRPALRTGAAALALAVVALLVVVLVQGLRARGEFEALVADGRELARLGTAAAGDGGDPVGTAPEAARLLTEAAAHARAAQGAVSGFPWDLLERAPWLGRQVHAAREVLGAGAGLLAETAAVADDLAPSVGDLVSAGPDGLDAGGLAAAAPSLESLAHALDEATARVVAVDPDGVVGPVAGARAELLDALAAAGPAVDAAQAVAQVLPAALAPGGSRSYLVLVQSPAEPRASGGLVGAALRLDVADGAVHLAEVVAGGDVVVPDPVLPLTPGEDALFGPRIAADLRDVGFTPDHPRAAELAAALWADRTGEQVDGVLFVDPAVLAAALQVTGPLRLPADPVAGASAVELQPEDVEAYLLRGVYLEQPDAAAQDAVFAAAAGEVLTRLTREGLDVPRLAVALRAVVAEGRLVLWSAHEDEQAVLEGSVVGGALTGSRTTAAGTAPVVGVAFNATTAAKTGYDLDVAADVRRVGCGDGASSELELRLHLASRAAATADLPERVAGGGPHAGSVAVNVLVYAPEGGHVVTADRDGDPLGLLAQRHDGLQVGGTSVVLPPGGTTTLVVTLTTAAGAGLPPVVALTPTARPAVVTVEDGCVP